MPSVAAPLALRAVTDIVDDCVDDMLLDAGIAMVADVVEGATQASAESGGES